jgi:ankyrin repeat protein
MIGNQAAAMILLLEWGANANIKDIYSDTPLINVLRDGALTAVQLLIEKALTLMLEINMIRLHSMPRRTRVMRRLSSNFSPIELA